MIKKKEQLNLREATDGRACCDCEHFIGKELRCTVIGTGVAQKYKVGRYDTCDAWNDKSYENTWYLAVVADRDFVYFQLKDVRSTPRDESEVEITDLGIRPLKLPVPSVAAEVFKTIKARALEHGAPDMVVNLNPAKSPGERLRDLLSDWKIKYQEIDVENDMEKRDDMIPPADLLSVMIDCYLRKLPEMAGV